METWRIIVRILIVIVFLFLLTNIDNYCFTYDNKETGEKINECGKKADLEKKYSKYLGQEKINFSNLTHEKNINFTYPN